MRKPDRSQTPRSLLILCLLGTCWAPAFAQRGTSEWGPELRKVQDVLAEQKWKLAKTKARKLAKKVAGSSWYGPDLGQVLAELDFAHAVADANLGNDREAIWYWHIACNLDFRLRRRDLAPYGEAAKLLSEFPLRRRGEVPPGFVVPESSPLVPETPPQKPDYEPPVILNNTAAAQDRPPDAHVEVVIDKEGRLHQPVMVSDYLHPILIHAVLEWLFDFPPCEPRRIQDEPVATLFTFTVAFIYRRW